jgi:hypothetical protein
MNSGFDVNTTSTQFCGFKRPAVNSQWSQEVVRLAIQPRRIGVILNQSFKVHNGIHNMTTSLIYPNFPDMTGTSTSYPAGGL